MSINTKERLLNDLEALRHQLAQIEAYGTDTAENLPEMLIIPTLEVDNIPLLGDVVPANREDAIIAHREAMAALDAELKDLDQKNKSVADQDADAKDLSSHIPTLNNDVSRIDVKNSDVKDVKTVDGKTTIDAPPIKNSIFHEYKLQPTTTVAFDPSIFKPIAKPDDNDDNPFLPQHLRERLNQSKNSLLEGIARSSESLDATTALLKNFNGETGKGNKTSGQGVTTHQLLIDALVAKYLPIIEADLRQQLNQSLAEKTQKESSSRTKTAEHTDNQTATTA